MTTELRAFGEDIAVPAGLDAFPMTNRIMVAAVFFAGCAVGGVSGQLVVPKANAQQAATLTKWEHFCTEAIDSDDFSAFANQSGSQGWELVTRHLAVGQTYACFKRPKL